MAATLLVLLNVTALASATRTPNEKTLQPVNSSTDPIVTNDLNSGLTPTDLVNNLLGGGVSVSNVVYTGANCAAGTFSGGTGIIGFESGIILSSGNISNVIGPNDSPSKTTDNGLPGDASLDALIPGYTTYDASVLEFDFVPTSSVITFQYQFGSEEYPEYVNSPFNDVFGFFLNGVNLALIPGTTTPVSINNVNNGNPSGNYPSFATNPNYFIDNTAGTLNTQLDGLTVVFSATAQVNAGVANHIKLAIADAGDHVLDSDVFIQASSFVSPTLVLTPLTATNKVGTSHTLTTSLVDPTGKPIVGQTITFTVASGPNAGLTGTAVTDSNGQASFTYQGNAPGIDTIVASFMNAQGKTVPSNSVTKTWIGFVVPEVPVGSIVTLTGFIAALGAFYFTKQKRFHL